MAVYIGDKNITDVVAGNALDSAKQYADQGDANTLQQAKDYTDSEVSQFEADYKQADATVLSEAKQYADQNMIPKSQKGEPGGLAELDETGHVPSSQLPSYVDDVIDVDTYSNLPNPGESGKIYITTDNNKQYRWSGTGYAEISSSLALGETSSTAYRGDRGKVAYEHSQIKNGNPHGTTFASLPDKPTSLPANGGNAESAVKDGDGNVIKTNYFKLYPERISDLNETPINSFFVSALGPSYSPVSYASFVNGFCFAANNNSSYKRQLVYADDWYGRTQNVGTWGDWYKFWHSGNLNPVTIDSDQIITGWKRFNPSTKNGVFNTTGIIDNKDTYATPLSWTAKTAGSIWNIQQESDSITLIGIQGGKAIKFLSNPSLTQVIADFFAGTATKAQQDGNGNVIASSYLRLTGGTLTGSLTTQNITAKGTVTADRFTGPLYAKYTGNGGQQGPGYIGTNSFGCLMMNTTINGDSSYKDWLICDAYDWPDAGGAIAIGVSRENMNVFAMSSDADRKTWTRKCQLYTTENANRNSVDWTAQNINASGTGTFKRLVINGIVIEVVNGNLRINGNLVATGGVTSQATA